MTRINTLKAMVACMSNAATMLEIADINDPDKDRRERCQQANRGQANLLRIAARDLDRLDTSLRELLD